MPLVRVDDDMPDGSAGQREQGKLMERTIDFMERRNCHRRQKWNVNMFQGLCSAVGVENDEVVMRKLAWYGRVVSGWG